MNEMTRVTAASVESQKARITTAQFLRMCDVGIFDDDDWKIELIEGELERMPPPHRRHSLLQTSILSQLVALFGVERVCIEIGIVLGDDTVVGCDVALLREPMVENRMIRAEEVLLAIEVAETTLKRDTGVKLANYAVGQVPHYWVVDGGRSIVHLYREPSGRDYARFELARFDEPLAVPGTDATITLT